MRQMQVLLTKAFVLLGITAVFILLGILRDCCCSCLPLVPARGSGCHSQSWYLCQPWAQQRAVPAANSCAFTCLGWPWPLQLAPCGCSGAGVRGWTAATGPAHTAGFVLGILGKTRVKKEKEKLLLSRRKRRESTTVKTRLHSNQAADTVCSLS